MQPPDLKNLALPGPVGMIAAIALAAGACDQSEMPSSVPPSETEVRTAVSQMVDDFLNLRMVQPFPAPLSLDEAYRWQNEFVGLLRPTMGEVVGYKTGGHNPGPVNPAFPPDGIRAQMLSGMFLEDGAAIRLDDVTQAGFLEADFALRVGSRAINEAETDLEILAGLDAVVPFAEVPDPYGAPDDNAMIRGVVSNMSTRIALAGDPVPVEPTEEWLQRIGSMEFAVLDENDRVIQSGSMAEWYQPIAVVRWLRDHLKMYGKELIPGQILSLGNIGIIRPLYDGTPRGEAYASDQFRIEYYGLKDDGPATVTIISTGATGKWPIAKCPDGFSRRTPGRWAPSVQFTLMVRAIFGSPSAAARIAAPIVTRWHRSTCTTHRAGGSVVSDRACSYGLTESTSTRMETSG